MSWLDAYESYVIEVAARDRADDLHSAADISTPIEQSTVPPDAIPDARRAAPAGPLLCLYWLARTSR